MDYHQMKEKEAQKVHSKNVDKFIELMGDKRKN